MRVMLGGADPLDVGQLAGGARRLLEARQHAELVRGDLVRCSRSAPGGEIRMQARRSSPAELRRTAEGDSRVAARWSARVASWCPFSGHGS